MSNVLQAAVAAMLVAAAGSASAQTWPQRPIRMVVAQPPGGTTDIVARLVAARLSERFGHQVVVDNRPGASGLIGAEIVSRSQPDGYTVLMAAGSFGTLNTFNPKAPVNVQRDFAPMALVAASPYMLVVQPALPAKTVAELVALAKARPGQLNFAGSGPGSLQRLAGELLNRTAGIQIMYVPYKGTGALLPDLIGGRLHVAIDNVLILVPHVRNNLLRGLAVTSRTRSSIIPELPPLAEAGVPGFEAVGWFGVFGATATPKAVVDRMNATVNAVMRDADMRERLVAQGADALSGTPEDLRRYLSAEVEKWGRIIREMNLRAD
jgi:tripartite-type tricarboxylate transporter receptor subunit TctC